MRNQKLVKPWRNKKYREFVADNPCLVCWIDGKSVPHHCRDLVETGWGTKPGDQWCIPVCDKCHTALHDDPGYISRQTKLNFIADSLNRWMK